MCGIDRTQLRDRLSLAKYSLVFFFLVLQIYLIFLKKHDTLDLDIYPNTLPTQLICGAQTVGQTFISESNNLCRVDIMMGTLARPNDKNLTFRLYQHDGQAENVRTTTVNAAGLLNNLYNSFVFKPVPRSKKKPFSWILSSPGSWPDNSVCAWMNKKNIYRKGSALINGAPARGDLVFRVYAKRRIFTELHRIVKNRPGILGKAWFLVLCICLFEVVSVLVLIRLIDVLSFSRERGLRGQDPFR
jgi:hypothetical protein